MDTRHLEHLEKRLNTFEEDIFSDRDINTSEFFKLKKELIDNRSDCKDLLELFDILESTLEKIQSDRTNKRLNVLTIWSTLFLPLSFFTGLFGMNFNDIPLLQNHYGFWFFVVISVITVGWLWVYFKRNKWF
jgi:magnesium transporter